MDQTEYAIIVAGGMGSRMGSALPKQFLNIAGRPILMHTLEAFYKYNPSIHLVVVMHPDYTIFWTDLVRSSGFSIPHEVVEGGEERFYSVKNGLNFIGNKAGVVGIHDAVRPLVSLETLRKCYSEAASYGSAVPVVAVTDSLRVLENGKNLAVDRARFRIVQTPQCFRIAEIQEAFRQDFSKSFTDDASVWEWAGMNLHLVEGNRDNIKITTPEDLRMAEAILATGQ
jgi:2-C-methyl-D-erythritol 4-phosphate cytidylyltransferase